MTTYTQPEAKFISDLVDQMFAVDYKLLSGASISTEDVPFRDERVQRSQVTSLCFVSQSLGTFVLFDFHTFGPLCNDTWMYRPTVRVRIGANFKLGGHNTFRSQHFSFAEHATKARLLFNCFDGVGDAHSKSIPLVENDEQVPGMFTYFNSWEYRAIVDPCCDQKKDAKFFIEDMEPALRSFNELTQPFTKIFMGSWPPADKFPGCENLYWSRWRDQMDLETAQPLLSAMRNT